MTLLGEATTDLERMAEEVIAEIPGLGGAGLSYSQLCTDVISPVHRGVESALWILRAPGEPDRVLKVLRLDMRDEFDVTSAVLAAEAAGAAGVGPAVEWANVATGALLMEHLGIGWRTATLADLQDAASHAAVLRAIRSLHDVSMPLPRHDVFAQIRTLKGKAIAHGVNLPADAWWLTEAAATLEAALSDREIALVPCRNDGVSSNIMLGPNGSVRLLDYDLAGLSDPLYDIGVLLTETCAFESEMAARLAVWEPEFDQATLDRCIAYGAADDLMWALWSALQAVRSPRVHVEFRKYAEWRFLRCRTTFGERRFEERLRRL